MKYCTLNTSVCIVSIMNIFTGGCLQYLSYQFPKIAVTKLGNEFSYAVGFCLFSTYLILFGMLGLWMRYKRSQFGSILILCTLILSELILMGFTGHVASQLTNGDEKIGNLPNLELQSNLNSIDIAKNCEIAYSQCYENGKIRAKDQLIPAGSLDRDHDPLAALGFGLAESVLTHAQCDR